MSKRLSMVMFVLLILSTVSAWAAPKLVVEEPQFHFGTITQGEKVPHAFAFSNAGDEPLVVEKVRSSCGCTAALVSAKELKPGETGEVQANFDSSRFRGNITKTVYLYTNDPLQPVTQLYIKGAVREIVTIEPAQISFNEAVAEKTVISQVILTNHSAATLQLDNLQATAQELKAVLADKELAPGESTTVSLSLTPKPGLGRFSGYVLLQVVSPVMQNLRVPVYATIKPQDP